MLKFPLKEVQRRGANPYIETPTYLKWSLGMMLLGSMSTAWSGAGSLDLKNSILVSLFGPSTAGL